jgi:hypothetical protein
MPTAAGGKPPSSLITGTVLLRLFPMESKNKSGQVRLEKRGARHRRIGLFVLSLVFAFTALWHWAGTVALVPGHRVVEAIRQGADTTEAELRQARKWLAISSALSRRGKDASELGLIDLWLANHQSVGNEERQAILIEASDAHHIALARAPVEPFAWSRLALIEKMRMGPTARGGRYLAASVLTGPLFDPLTALRIGRAVDLWPVLAPETRRLFAGQIDLLWRTDPDSLIALASRSEAEIIIAATLDRKNHLPAFAKALATFRQNDGTSQSPPSKAP